MRLRATAALVLAVSAAPVAAERADLNVGGAFWWTQLEGTLDNGERLAVGRDLALDSDDNVIAEATVTLGIPGRPELLFEYARLGASGSTEVDRDLAIGDLTLIANRGTLDTRVRADDGLVALRRTFRLGWLRVAPGVALRHVSGDVLYVEDAPLQGITRERQAVSRTFPMAHLGLGIGAGRLRFEGRGHFVEHDSDRVFDLRGVLWMHPSPRQHLRIGVGWQLRDYRFSEADGDGADLRVDGLQVLLGGRW